MPGSIRHPVVGGHWIAAQGRNDKTERSSSQNPETAMTK
jgi:hypothetical protein